MEENKPIWVSLRELIKLLKEMDMWTIDTKYLNIYLDTRFFNGDLHCTIKDRENKRYLSIEDIREALKEEIIYKGTYLKSLLDCKQECEDLKKELDKEHLLMLEKQDKATRYFLVLNGIKEYIYNNTDFDVNDSIQSKTSGYDILQIIKDV